MTERSLFPYIPATYTEYMDFFCVSHQNDEPMILEDGTSVLFPAGWTDEDADKWRKGFQLRQPNGYTARTFVC